ncbi:fimbrial biogenesis chaperone [Luteimonas sp. A482]
MSFFLHRAPRAVACACAVFAALAGSAAAAEFSLNPTRVHLDRARAIETLVLGNADPLPLSFEASVKRWTMAADGSWELQPSDDLVVHPLVFTVQPGEQARLRVGTLKPEASSERAYRVELQQLPRGSVDGVAIEVLTRVSVPVFIQAASPAPEAGLSAASFGSEGLQLTLANTGSQYLPPQDARLRLLDASGRILAESPLTIGYVLAGAQLPLPAQSVSAAACTQAARVELELPESAATLVAPLPASPRRCGG